MADHMPQLTKGELENIRRTQSAAMRKAVLSAFTNIRTDATLSAIVARIDAGDIEGAIQAININRAQFADMEAAIIDAYTVGGTATAAQIGRVAVPDGAPIVVRFNARSPRAERFIRDHSSQLIVQIIDDQRAMARSVLLSGLEAGRAPRATALDIIGRVDRATGRRAGGFIGLTEQHASYTRTMRDALTNKDALGSIVNPDGKVVPKFWIDEQGKLASAYSRRDRRFDGAIKRALQDGVPLPSNKVDAMVGRYNDSLLQLRGETIARTESISALRAGQQESIVQAMEEADVRPEEAKKTWSTSGDGRVRDLHDEMDGQERLVDEPFDSPTGAQLLYPGDSSLGAGGEDVINCRCSSEISVDFIGRALRLDGF